jgi:putative iron-dependent peroxidase
MSTPQPGILAPVPGHARYLEFGAVPDADHTTVLRALASLPVDEGMVVGLGAGLVQGLGKAVAPLRAFPALSGPGCEVPSTQADLWCWLRGDDRGDILHRGRSFTDRVQPAFRCDRLVDGFKYDRGLDLSGYEDGTENPVGDDAVAAAIWAQAGPGLDGSSFVAVQQWRHDLDHFAALDQGARDNIIGRRLSDNEELDDAPASAHVKRTAQESFEPEAFVVRRSMPWADVGGEGLMFVAFGKSLDAYEVQMRRMAGLDDGIVDGLFRFSRPLSGSYFWCPPVADDGTLDLSALGF